jgi:phenylalanyl-tRNA synthetase alpha chain
LLLCCCFCACACAVPYKHPPPQKKNLPNPNNQDIAHARYEVKPDAVPYAKDGSPEAQVFAAVPAGPDGITLTELKARLPAEIADVGFRQAMAQRWVATDKGGGGEPRVVRRVEAADDALQRQLATLLSGGELPAAELEALHKKRKVLVYK